MASLVGERRATQPLYSQNIDATVFFAFPRQRRFPRVELS